MKNRVTKLNQSKIELSNGVTFTIVHNFKNMDGNVNSFDSAFQNWLSRTSKYDADSFVDYVKSTNEPDRIFMTLEDFENRTKGKRKSATKEDYEAENN